MKSLKSLYLILITSILFTSCSTTFNEEDFVSLEDVITDYDIWYVDFNRTSGNGTIVPFVEIAFTFSFSNGTLYANNNIVDIGFTGNGRGIPVGEYFTDRGILEINHDLDGFHNFNVTQISNNELRLDDISNNVSYFLIGSSLNNFDFDGVFFDNIEFFLQEYGAWERTAIEDGVANIFDEERFLQFSQENNTTFYSSTNPFGTDVANLNRDFVGSYFISDVAGFDDLKGLTLNYDSGDTETFELRVINDGEIELFHQTSETFYTFTGIDFIELLKGERTKTTTRSARKRTIIKRPTVDRKDLN